jgi:hypothetical protein
MTTRRLLRFMIALRDVEPLVWRRIEVPSTYSFWDLHVGIQDAMGWQDYHLHAFRVRDLQSGDVEEIGIPDPDGFGPDFVAGWERQIADYFRQVGDAAEYEYDFGDGWVHQVTLEAIGNRQVGVKYPRCLDGARACPPEDSGGPPGYAALIEAVAEPSREAHRELVEWAGANFDPGAFDAAKVRFDNPKRRWRIAFSDE